MPAVCGENVQVIYYSARQDVRRIKNVARNAAPAGHYDPGPGRRVSTDPRLPADDLWIRRAHDRRAEKWTVHFGPSFLLPPTRPQILTSGSAFLPPAPRSNEQTEADVHLQEFIWYSLFARVLVELETPASNNRRHFTSKWKKTAPIKHDIPKWTYKIYNLLSPRSPFQATSASSAVFHHHRPTRYENDVLYHCLTQGAARNSHLRTQKYQFLTNHSNEISPQHTNTTSWNVNAEIVKLVLPVINRRFDSYLTFVDHTRRSP